MKDHQNASIVLSIGRASADWQDVKTVYTSVKYRCCPMCNAKCREKNVRELGSKEKKSAEDTTITGQPSRAWTEGWRQDVMS
jgi:hypothetical protein